MAIEMRMVTVMRTGTGMQLGTMQMPTETTIAIPQQAEFRPQPQPYMRKRKAICKELELEQEQDDAIIRGLSRQSSYASFDPAFMIGGNMYGRPPRSDIVREDGETLPHEGLIKFVT